MTSRLTAEHQRLAQRIAMFVAEQGIDLQATPMDEVVERYRQQQDERYAALANQLKAVFLLPTPERQAALQRMGVSE